MSLKLNIIVASTRPGRAGPAIGQWAAEAATAHGRFDVEVVDLADVGLPLLDEAAHPSQRRYEHEHTQRWSRSVDGADAFVMVTPEYNYFPPASLVNAIQVVLHEWRYKPAGVISYGGVSGGLRATQALRQLLGNVGAMALPQSVAVPNFRQFIGEDGAFRPGEHAAHSATTMLDELEKWAGALKPLREAPAA